MAIIECPKCGNDFDDYSKWGPKKFCSRKCANSRSQTAEVREKKSRALQKETECQYCKTVLKSVSGARTHELHCLENPHRIPGIFFNKTHTVGTKKQQGKNNAMGVKVPKSLLDMSKRTSSKVMKRLGIGCFTCGWDLGSCDIHHIVPRSQGGTDLNENLTYICPNCHRLAHEGKLTTFTTVEEKVGNVWRDHYYAHE